MSEIRNLTRNGETFYPLTHVDGVLNRDGTPLGVVNDIFDVSEYNASGDPLVFAKYDTLSLALAAVPSDKQKGGMTIRYIQSSDNKYIQARCMAQNFTTDVTQWQGVDDEPTAGSNNLVKSGGVDTINSLKTFIAAGGTAAIQKSSGLKAIAGHTYRFDLRRTSWNYDNPGNRNIFFISYSIDGGETFIDLFSKGVSSESEELNRSYIRSIPSDVSDSVELYIRGRGAAGEKVEVIINDITNLIRKDKQSLTDEEKTQVVSNIGLTKAVRSDITQSFTDEEKEKARENIGADFEKVLGLTDNGIYVAETYGGYARYDSGKINLSSNNWLSYIIPNRLYKSIKVTIACSDNVPAAIAFYSSYECTRDSYMQSASVQSTTTSAATRIQTYIANVPDGCKAIFVTNHKNYQPSPTIELTKIDSDIVGNIMNDIISLDKRITINTNNITTNANNISTLSTRVDNLSRGAVNPFQYKPYYAHFAANSFMLGGSNEKLIPSQSIYDVEMAARLGFGFIEANIKKTSDNKYVCIHGSSGKFGPEVGNTYKDYVIAETTSTFIAENIRYATDVAKYNTPVTTLEQFLDACKLNNIGILAGTNEVDAIQMCIDRLGEEKVILYGASSSRRSIFGGLMYTWFNNTGTTKADILSYADTYGAPYVAALGPTVLSELEQSEDLEDLIAEMHRKGYLIGFAAVYSSEADERKYWKMGFDMSGSGHQVNRFTSNYELFDIDEDITDFVTNGTYANRVLTLTDGQTIECGSTDNIWMGQGALQIRFSGTITVDFGSVGERTVTSDNNEVKIITDYFLSNDTHLTITADGAVTINSLVYMTCKC